MDKRALYQTAVIAVDGLDLPKDTVVSVRYMGLRYDGARTHTDQPVYHVSRDGTHMCLYEAALTRFVL